jgi:undecaprenyl-diphosphatase
MSLGLRIFFFLNNLAGQSHFFDFIVIFLADYLQYFLIIPFGIFVYRSRERLYAFGVPIIAAVIARFGLVTIIRLFYHRLRPFLVFQVHQLIALPASEIYSFPSGHSTFFFAISAAIYLYNKKWGLWFFLASIFMNISRIIGGVHYPSDILGGMILGPMVAYITFYIAERMKPKTVAKVL